MRKSLVILMLMASSAFGASPHILKTNTATVLFVGPFVDFEDGVTPETGMTVTNITCELFKETVEGSVPTRTAITLAASGSDNDMVHITSDVAGMYSVELTAAQLNFYGNARLCFTDPDVMCPVWENLKMVPAHIYDSEMGTDYQNVDTVAVSGDTTSADNMELDYDGTGYAGGTINRNVDVAEWTLAPHTVATQFSDALTSTTTAEAVWDAAAASYVDAGTIGKLITDIDSDTAAILSDTGTDGVVLINDAITAAKIADNAITADQIGASAIGASEIAADAIGASEIATDAVDADALATDAVTEIWATAMSDLAAGAPSATASVKTAINYLYELMRNKLVQDRTANEIRLYKDDGSTILMEADISDSGTATTRSEYGAED